MGILKGSANQHLRYVVLFQTLPTSKIILAINSNYELCHPCTNCKSQKFQISSLELREKNIDKFFFKKIFQSIKKLVQTHQHLKEEAKLISTRDIAQVCNNQTSLVVSRQHPKLNIFHKSVFKCKLIVRLNTHHPINHFLPPLKWANEVQI